MRRGGRSARGAVTAPRAFDLSLAHARRLGVRVAHGRGVLPRLAEAARLAVHVHVAALCRARQALEPRDGRAMEVWQ